MRTTQSVGGRLQVVGVEDALVQRGICDRECLGQRQSPHAVEHSPDGDGHIVEGRYVRPVKQALLAGASPDPAWWQRDMRQKWRCQKVHAPVLSSADM